MLKRSGLALIFSALSMLSSCQKSGDGFTGKSNFELKTEQEKTLYALGLLIGRNVSTFNLKPDEFNIVVQGLSDSVNHKKPAVEMQAYAPKVSEMARSRQAAFRKAEEAREKPLIEERKKKGQAYVDSFAKEPGVTRYPSGLVMKTLMPGSGESPKPNERVRANYRGTSIEGVEFDNSAKHGNQPSEFSLLSVVPCWQEALQKMKTGEKAKLVCPSTIAYGDQGRPNIPGGSTLVFEVELVEVKPPTAPAAVSPLGLPPPGRGITPSVLPPSLQRAPTPAAPTAKK
jgi:FKBP-type peptidyl-prolyl cis-trans isomerase FkpA